MKKYCLLLFTACLLLSGQNVGRAQGEDKKAQHFDSYGDINSESAMARLDNFALELMKSPGAIGYLIFYGPEGEGAGTATHILKVQKDYLINTRGLELERVQTIYGGRYYKPDEIETELWIAQHGASEPELKGYKSSLETIRGKFTEYSNWDGFPEDGGPPFGHVKLTALADVLKQQPKSLAYIVAYNLIGAPPGTWRRVAKREADILKGYGINSDRIKIIYGGERKADADGLQMALIQLWVLPPDAPPPVEEAEPEATPKEAAHLGTYNSYILKYREEERHVFEGLLDMLRADARLSVCLIVRPRGETPGAPLMPDEPPDIDLAGLVEKWKAEMVEKYRLGGNRIIVMLADEGDTVNGTIEAWVVPAGASLPNPYSSNDESLDENPQEP